MFKNLFAVATLAMLTAPAAFAADLEGRVLKIGTDATYPPMETVDEMREAAQAR